MKRIFAGLVVLFSVGVFAEDSKTETKLEQKTSGKKTTTTVESKSTVDPDGAFNSTTDKFKAQREVKRTADGGVDTTTTEVTKSHDAPGMKNDSSKKKIVRDADGNVIKESREVKK